ncbi:MAG: HAD-IA family hydrolase [Saprospiraceae bacterium]|nr:HAD-IA family hydrolase [Candidatus Opimibacter skivensis]
MACKDFHIPYRYNETYNLYKQANNLVKTKDLTLISDTDYELFRTTRAKLFLNELGYSTIDPLHFTMAQLKYSEKGKLIKCVYKTLKQIHPNIRIVIGTNGSNYPRKNKVANSRIKYLIDAFYSSEDLGVQKPDPRFFKLIISHYKSISKEDVLVIGDNINTDIRGALKANINCCLFNYKKLVLPKLPLKVQVIESFCEIINIIK